jgi:hypothetical protein
MRKPKHLIIKGPKKQIITLDTTDGKRITKGDIRYVYHRYFKKKAGL